MSDYRCPPLWNDKGEPTDEKVTLGWLNEAIQEGTNFLKSQRGYGDIDRAMDILAGPGDERIPQALSRVHSNRLKRQVREIVATLSNLRPIWNYKTDNKELADQGALLGKLVKAWYHTTFADRSIREAVQYAAVEATGYISPIWERDFWATGRGDIKLYTYGAKDVLPVQLPRDGNLQRAYAVILKTEVPIALAHAMYPLLADRIVPDRTRPTWLRQGLKKLQRFVSPALQLTDQDREREESWPTVDIFNTYILDLSINKTGRVIPMGKPGTSWSYTVPYVGMDIPSGVNDTAGHPLYRKATWEDALLFPARRLMIATKAVVLEDGPSPWWHRKVPIVKFSLDDWPWSYLGFSALRDGASIQAARNRILRLIDDNGQARIRPPLIFDEGQIAESTMAAFDTRQPNMRMGVNMALGPPITPVLPPAYYDIPQWIFELLQVLTLDMDYVAAHGDMAALAKARQLPASDTIEKLFEVLGPIPQDQSRNMERGVTELGDMIKYLIFQWYNAKRRTQMLGADGWSVEDVDYDPGNLIPARTEQEANEDYYSRVRRHAENFTFHVTPYSAHQITQLSRQMVLVQLFRSGFPLDPWTIAEAMDLPDFGPEPEGTKNVIERWVAWTRMKGEMAGEMQAEAAAAAQSGGIASLLGGAGGGNPPGRPPSGQEPPKMVSKDSGTRATVSESG